MSAIEKLESETLKNYNTFRLKEIAETNSEEKKIYREIWMTSAEIIRQINSIKSALTLHKTNGYIR